MNVSPAPANLGALASNFAAAPVNHAVTNNAVAGPAAVGGLNLGVNDRALAQAIDKSLEGSPIAGLGEHFVEAGRLRGVDPVGLAAISKHETNFGRLGVGIDKHMGVGAFDANPNKPSPWDGAINQVDAGAKTFDHLRDKAGISPDAPFSEQTKGVNEQGWATDKSWHVGVDRAYDKLSAQVDKAMAEAADATDKANQANAVHEENTHNALTEKSATEKAADAAKADAANADAKSKTEAADSAKADASAAGADSSSSNSGASTSNSSSSSGSSSTGSSSGSESSSSGGTSGGGTSGAGSSSSGGSSGSGGASDSGGASGAGSGGSSGAGGASGSGSSGGGSGGKK